MCRRVDVPVKDHGYLSQVDKSPHVPFGFASSGRQAPWLRPLLDFIKAKKASKGSAAAATATVTALVCLTYSRKPALGRRR